jgi:hypothetical protein
MFLYLGRRELFLSPSPTFHCWKWKIFCKARNLSPNLPEDILHDWLLCFFLVPVTTSLIYMFRKQYEKVLCYSLGSGAAMTSTISHNMKYESPALIQYRACEV